MKDIYVYEIKILQNSWQQTKCVVAFFLPANASQNFLKPFLCCYPLTKITCFHRVTTITKTTKNFSVGFEVLMTVTMQSMVF
jgi:hypothetical protein